MEQTAVPDKENDDDAMHKPIEQQYDIPRSIQHQIEASSSSTLHNSLRAARHAKLSASDETAGGSVRKSGGVSFTSDTRDNEGFAKKYEKEGLPFGEKRHSPVPKVEVFDDTIAMNQPPPQEVIEPEPPALVHKPTPVSVTQKPTEYVKPMEAPKVDTALTPQVDHKPVMKDECVATDNDPLDDDHPDALIVQSKNHEKLADTIQRQDYSLTVTSPRGILKHPNGTATLQLNQPNQLVIASPDKSATLPNSSLRVNTNFVGTNRSVSYSPTLKLAPQSPSYTLRRTGDNISIVSISGYDPAWETRSNYSTDTIRTLDDYQTGTMRTMVSLGTYTNPYTGNELVGNNTAHYRREINESSTDPLAYDSKLFEYNQVSWLCNSNRSRKLG